jgi:hypothetical protein
LQRWEAAGLITELTSDGIFTTVGTYSNAPLFFLHRTFYEYLAAGGLAQQKPWLATALLHVYDPTWQEVLRLLGGQLKERVREYITVLIQENTNDMLCRPFWHALRASREASPGCVPLSWDEGYLCEAITLLCNGSYPCYEHFRLLIVEFGVKAVPALRAALQDPDEDVRKAAAQVLGQIGGSEAVAALGPALQDRDPGVRRAVAVALGQIAQSQGIPVLVTQASRALQQWTRALNVRLQSLLRNTNDNPRVQREG